MSLFVTSIGLAFILRASILFVGRQRTSGTFRVDLFQVYSIGGVRLSERS